MRNQLDRRNFLKTSVASASAVALSAGVSRGFPANEKVRIAWIGYGGRATALLKHMQDACPNAAHIAMCDLKQDRIDAGLKAAEQDKPRGYKDFREMLDQEKPDGVMVVTAPCDHATVVVPVLDAGFNTFAEKPMDITVEKIDAITKAARASKGIYQIGTQRRSHPLYRQMIQAVWDGVAGNMQFLQGGWHWHRDPSNARVARDGGRFIEQASHHTDVMSWVMKDAHPIRCTAMGFAYTGSKPSQFSETESATIFEFPGGVLFSYTHLWLLPKKYQTEILRAFGDKGCMDFNQAVFTSSKDEKEQRYGDVIGQEWGSGTPESLAHFVDCIKTGNRTPWASVETGRICSLMCIMARMAMVNAKKDIYEPSVVTWKDIGSTTDL